MTLNWLIVVALLGVWRVTRLLVAEDGPWDISARLREAMGHGMWGKLFDCFSCLSLWVSAPFAFTLAATGYERVLLWPALSGGAIIIERLVARCEAPPPLYFDNPASKEVDDVVLRK
jgi:hypothetical protein